MFLHTSESQSNEPRNLKQLQNSSSNVYNIRKEYEDTGERKTMMNLWVYLIYSKITTI